MKAKLFVGMMYSNIEHYNKAIELLEKDFGEIELEGEEFDFNFTKYYEKEMGKNLKKRFVLFKKPIDRVELPDIKLQTIKLEEKSRKNGKRQVNIDPGYITLNNVIVASTKELPHRIYLNKGIFADLLLLLKKKDVIPFKHTFTDYEQSKDFFLKARQKMITSNSQQ
ncbi:hypothetical protein A3K72_02090 [Candidatus Woesearchaeota archaeon RBG_13_36_6]|nr:MAG: hypothetical protein A3K72_02090 [Candidatus Woesearchaeota archaeon RBG_13_36_6]